MQSRNSSDPIFFGVNFNFSTYNLVSGGSGGYVPPNPPVTGDFLLLDGTNFLLLDGTNFLLL